VEPWRKGGRQDTTTLQTTGCEIRLTAVFEIPSLLLVMASDRESPFLSSQLPIHAQYGKMTGPPEPPQAHVRLIIPWNFDDLAIPGETGGVEALVRRLTADLYGRQLPKGGWAFSNESRQMALEPTCLAMLALHPTDSRTVQLLVDIQRSDGSCGSFTGDDQSSGLTGLALFALNALGIVDDARRRAAHWVLQNRGKEADWPWRWKFRWRDTHVRFDPGKFGWPWHVGICSWVVPTSFALLALKREFPHRRPRKVASRIRTGVEMLLDRVCPGGGWNAGNGVVFDTPMMPHIDATAIALLALQDEPLTDIINRSLACLVGKASDCKSLWSLAWSTLTLQAWRRDVGRLRGRLARLAESGPIHDTATLAAVLLAFESTISANPFRLF
jgi:hypothetical protein